MKKRAAVLALILCTAAVLAAGNLLPFSGGENGSRVSAGEFFSGGERQ